MHHLRRGGTIRPGYSLRQLPVLRFGAHHRYGRASTFQTKGPAPLCRDAGRCAGSASQYEGQRGDVYYVERMVTVMTDKGPRQRLQRVPKIRWTPVRGRVRRFFDDVLVIGSKALPKAAADALEPWDLHAMVPYTESYLAGFRAEGYTIDLRTGFAAARGEMDLQIARDVRFDIGGDQQRIRAVETDFAVIAGAIGMALLIGALYASGALDNVAVRGVGPGGGFVIR